MTYVSDKYDSILKAIYNRDKNKVDEIVDSFGPQYLLPWEEGQSLIKEALTDKRQDIAKILIERGCHIGDTLPLYLHSFKQKYRPFEFVESLLKIDPESVHKFENGSTLLHQAINHDQDYILELLISYGANVNIPNHDGYYPVNTAVTKGRITTLKILLEAGASTETEFPSGFCSGKTSLFFAVECGMKDIAQLLLTYGANCNAKTHNGKTMLHSAVEQARSEIAQMLIKYGADVEQRNSKGQTPLHLACVMENRCLTNLLLNAGADVNAVDQNGIVPCSSFGKIVVSSCTFIDSPISYLLLQRLILLNEAGLYLHRKNKDNLFIFLQTYVSSEFPANVLPNLLPNLPPSPLVMANINRSREEIGFMKDFHSGTINSYEVLKRLDNPLYIASETEIALLQTVIEGGKCPLYSVIMKAQVKYARLRNHLYSQAKQCFSVIIDFSGNVLPSLPEEMIRLIASLLNNSELDLLIKNVKELKLSNLE